jgi:serine protease AprX
MTSFFLRAKWLRAGAAVGLLLATLGDARPLAQERASVAGLERLDTRLRELVAARDGEAQRVIIRVRRGARAAMRQQLEQHGDSVLAEHASVEALTAVVHGDDLARLAVSDGVESVSTDAVIRARLLGGLLGGLLGTVGGVVGGLVGTVGGLLGGVGLILDPAKNTEGPPVPPAVLRQTLGTGSTWTGRGVGVAVIDSGLEMSSDFENRVMAFYDMTAGKTLRTVPFDDYGHGTHVAGAIGASGARSYNREYRGLAPNARFLVLKVLDANGAGYTSDVIRAVDFAVANRDRYGIDIINLSLGHPIYEPAGSDPLVQAVERASRAGIVVMAAAGNLGIHPETGLPGYAGITSPGNAPSAITVGAVRTLDTVSRSDDRVAEYSSAGPTWYDAIAKPDIVAPGHNIVATAAKYGSLYRTYPNLKAADADYMRLSGTSMATAVATGVVAQALEAHKDAHPYDPPPSPNFVKAALQYTAIDVRNNVGLQEDPLRQGVGALNAKGAIDLARATDTSAPNGSWWLTRTLTPSTAIGGESHVWKQTIIWGNTVVWGNMIAVNEQAWSSTIIWGNTVVWGSTVVWGNNVVWTQPDAWASTIIWGNNTIGQSQGDTIIWGNTQGMTPETTVWQDLPQELSTP